MDKRIKEKKNWFRRHWIISIILGFFILGVIFNIGNNTDVKTTNEQKLELELTLIASEGGLEELPPQVIESAENSRVLYYWTLKGEEKANFLYYSSENYESLLNTLESEGIKDSFEKICGNKLIPEEMVVFSEEGSILHIRISDGKIMCDMASKELVALSEELTAQKNGIITKSPESMLPLPSELPTEYSIGKKEDILGNSTIITSKNAQDGFDSGRQMHLSKYTLLGSSVMDVIQITFGVYKFDNSDFAYQFQNKVVQKVINGGGYEKVSVSADAECFAWKRDYGYDARFGNSICYNKNIVYWIDVTISNSLKQPDSILKKMVKIADRKVK